VALERHDIERIIENIQGILKDAGNEKLKRTCQALSDEVDHYDWVGFYVVDKKKDRELVLGPFVGEPTEHTKIVFGEGICGQAADSGKLFLIQDVSEETNYLSCSATVRSEIVLPIFKDDELIGELDIDSHQLEPFNDLDTELLERICALVSSLI
jgi:L-methionine (R)-S-oxide reductase